MNRLFRVILLHSFRLILIFWIPFVIRIRLILPLIYVTRLSHLLILIVVFSHLMSTVTISCIDRIRYPAHQDASAPRQTPPGCSNSQTKDASPPAVPPLSPARLPDADRTYSEWSGKFPLDPMAYCEMPPRAI